MYSNYDLFHNPCEYRQRNTDMTYQLYSYKTLEFHWTQTQFASNRTPLHLIRKHQHIHCFQRGSAVKANYFYLILGQNKES